MYLGTLFRIEIPLRRSVSVFALGGFGGGVLCSSPKSKYLDSTYVPRRRSRLSKRVHVRVPVHIATCTCTVPVHVQKCTDSIFLRTCLGLDSKMQNYMYVRVRLHVRHVRKIPSRHIYPFSDTLTCIKKASSRIPLFGLRGLLLCQPGKERASFYPLSLVKCSSTSC